MLSIRVLATGALRHLGSSGGCHRGCGDIVGCGGGVVGCRGPHRRQTPAPQPQRHAHHGAQVQADDAVLAAETRILQRVGEDARFAGGDDVAHHRRTVARVVRARGVEVALHLDLHVIGVLAQQQDAALCTGQRQDGFNHLLENVVETQRRVERLADLQERPQVAQVFRGGLDLVGGFHQVGEFPMGAEDHDVAVGAAQTDAVVVAQRLRAGDPDVVDEGAVGAAEVFDDTPIIAVRDANVLARHGGVENLQLVGCASPDRHGTPRQRQIGVLAVLVLHHQVGTVLYVAFVRVVHVHSGCFCRLQPPARQGGDETARYRPDPIDRVMGPYSRRQRQAESAGRVQCRPG